MPRQNSTAEIDAVNRITENCCRQGIASYTNEMCIEYLVISDPITWDVDGDGQTDTVTVCAKADTNEMRGYIYDSNIFSLSSILL